MTGAVTGFRMTGADEGGGVSNDCCRGDRV